MATEVAMPSPLPEMSPKLDAESSKENEETKTAPDTEELQAEQIKADAEKTSDDAPTDSSVDKNDDTPAEADGEKPPIPSPEQLREWTSAISAGLASFKTVESRLRKCLEALDWKNNIKHLEAAVQEHQEELLRLKKTMGGPVDHDDAADDRRSRSRSRTPRRASSTSISPPHRRYRSLNQYPPVPPGMPYQPMPLPRPRRVDARSVSPEFVPLATSIPELKFLPWKDVVLGALSKTKYYAIEVPCDEPSRTDLLQMSDRPHHAAERSETEESTAYNAPQRIPERIRINSLRLQSFIRYDILAGETIVMGGSGPLHILRPFKLLLHVKDKLRSRLQDFESARKQSRDDSEEAYTAELNDPGKKPIYDDEEFYKINESCLDIRKLTAYILDLRCLDRFISTILEPEIARITSLSEPVRFADLWYIFREGTSIYATDKRFPQRVWRVVGRGGGRWNHGGVQDRNGDIILGFSPFYIDCFYFDHDGERIWAVYLTFEINAFEGTQEVQNLYLVPLEAAEKDKTLFDREAAVERGRRFLECANKPCHRYYSGRSLHLNPRGDKLAAPAGEEAGLPRNASSYSEKVDSEVIVDFAKALQDVPYWQMVGHTHLKYGDAENLESENGRYRGQQGSVDQDFKWNHLLMQQFMEPEIERLRAWADKGEIPTEPDDLIILSDRIFAFVLRTRKWVCLPLGKDQDGRERLQLITPRVEPWNELELPRGHKDVVQSLIESHFSKDKTRKMHLDLVRDKGKGVIILLHGVPGVGKTSTAECAAESNGRPLLPITCGDLGLEPDEVESRLQEIFRLAHVWDCVLLLDEADIFLARRDPTDIRRNALVSVFLRVLEYYEGILFLTTNRVGTFDEAFKSRIHMSLYYPPLDESQTYKIWNTHIKKVQDNGIAVDRRDVLDFASQIWNAQRQPGRGPAWNGRQIRNAFQSAIALAGFHKEPGERLTLAREHFRRVNEVSDQFSQYIFKTMHSMTDADWNRMHMMRRDDFNPNAGSPWGATAAAAGPVVDAFGQPVMPAPMQRPVALFGGPQSASLQTQFGQPVGYPGYAYQQNMQQPQQQQQGFQQPPQQQQPQQQQPQGFPQQQQSFSQPGMSDSFQGGGYPPQQVPRTMPQQVDFSNAQQQPASQPTTSQPNMIAQGSTGSSLWE